MRYILSSRKEAYILKKDVCVDDIYKMVNLIIDKYHDLMIVSDTQMEESKDKINEAVGNFNELKSVTISWESNHSLNGYFDNIEYIFSVDKLYTVFDNVADIVSIPEDNQVRTFDLLNCVSGLFDDNFYFMLIKFYSEDQNITIRDHIINFESYMNRITKDKKYKDALISKIARIATGVDESEYDRMISEFNSMDDDTFREYIITNYMEGVYIICIPIDVPAESISPSTPINIKILNKIPNDDDIELASYDFISQMSYDYYTWLSDIVSDDMENSVDVVGGGDSSFKTFSDLSSIEENIFDISKFINDGSTLSILNKLKLRYGILRYIALNENIQYYTVNEYDFFKTIKLLGMFVDDDGSECMEVILNKFISAILQVLSNEKLISLLTSNYNLVPAEDTDSELLLDHIAISVLSGFVNVVDINGKGLILTTGIHDYRNTFKVNRKDDDSACLDIKKTLNNAISMIDKSKVNAEALELFSDCILDVTFTVPVVDDSMAIVGSKEITAEELIYMVVYYAPSIISNMKELIKDDTKIEFSKKYVADQLSDRYNKSLVQYIMNAYK